MQNTYVPPALLRYLLSSVITFVATFLMLLGTNLQNINPATLTTASVLGLILVCVRAATKVALEAIVGGHADLPSVGAPKTPQQ